MNTMLKHYDIYMVNQGTVQKTWYHSINVVKTW